MVFSEYVTVLKKHFSKSISNEELCGILFDSVIVPLDLKNKNGDTLVIDKRTVSKIMNDRQNVPFLIRDNIYETAVLSGLVEYFYQNIVSELIPQKEDICYQLMELVNADPHISPQHRAEFQILATPSSIATFLAELFIYAATNDVHVNHDVNATTKNKKTNSSSSELIICGISNNELSSEVVAENILKRAGISQSIYINKIMHLYEDAKGIHLKPKLTVAVLSIKPEVKISLEEKNILQEFADNLEVDLPSDFLIWEI